MSTVVILGAARTPMGSFQGVFSNQSAPDLGGAAIKGALDDAGVSPDAVGELHMGCVLSAGIGQAPARQAGFKAGLTESVPANTLNKMCGSGMRTVMMAHDQIALGQHDVVVAGGMESMTQAPYMLPKMRAGARIGHQTTQDHMFLDGLEDAYDKGRLMGTFAEDCAQAFQFTREDQDAYAIGSLERANAAQSASAFDREIVPVTVSSRKSTEDVSLDEQPGRAKPDKIPHLKPAFREDGTVTAANSSSISDGAAALLLSSDEYAQRCEIKPRATIVGHASFAHAPKDFPTAPIPATKRLLDSIGWGVDDVEIWEVNEAFAVVPMAFMKEMNISHEKMNVNGGACALGHPIGASGARILVTLLNAMEKRGLKRGVAAICIGGGEGTAMAIERA